MPCWSAGKSDVSGVATAGMYRVAAHAGKRALMRAWMKADVGSLSQAPTSREWIANQYVSLPLGDVLICGELSRMSTLKFLWAARVLLYPVTCGVRTRTYKVPA